MSAFIGTLILVLISAFAIILAGVLLVAFMSLPIGKWMDADDEFTWVGRQSWRKIIALTLACFLLLVIEITVAVGLGVFRDDASLHCGSGTTYHYNGKSQPWTCELS